MSDFDDDDCIERYFERARATPGFLHNPRGKVYEILSDPDEMRRAAAAARKDRAVKGLPAGDVRVGVLADDPYVTVVRDAVRFPDGTHGLYYRLLLGTGFVMLPLLHDKIVLINAFRHGTRRWHLEAPRGMFDGTDPLEAQIRREIREEIGATAGEITEMGMLHPSPGVIDEHLHLTAVRVESTGEVDKHEAISEIKVLSVAEFESLAASGEITDGPTLAVYLRAKLRRLV